MKILAGIAGLWHRELLTYAGSMAFSMCFGNVGRVFAAGLLGVGTICANRYSRCLDELGEHYSNPLVMGGYKIFNSVVGILPYTFLSQY